MDHTYVASSDGERTISCRHPISKLSSIQVGVEPILLDKFGVGAALHDSAIADGEYSVGGSDSAEAMRDHNTGSTFEQRGECFLNDLLRPRVYVTRRLVKTRGSVNTARANESS